MGMISMLCVLKKKKSRGRLLAPFLLKNDSILPVIQITDLFLTFLLKWRISGALGGTRTGDLAARCLNPLC